LARQEILLCAALRLRTLEVDEELDCGVGADARTKVGDLGRRYWLRIPSLESMVVPLAFRPPCVAGGIMRFVGCVWVTGLANIGGYDGCFSGEEVLASDHVGWAFAESFFIDLFLDGIS
jgi:hypothetical protein